MACAVTVALRTTVQRQIMEVFNRHSFRPRCNVRVPRLQREVFMDNRAPCLVFIEEHLEHAVQVPFEMAAIQFDQGNAETGWIAVPVMVTTGKCALAC